MERGQFQTELDKALLGASNLAKSTKDSHMRISHVVYTILAQSNIVSSIIVESIQADMSPLMSELKTYYENQTDGQYKKENPPVFSEVLTNLVNNLLKVLQQGEFLSIESLFIHIFDTDDAVIQILTKYKITSGWLEEKIQNIRLASNVNMRDEDENDIGYKPMVAKKSKTPFLDDFGRDLTEMAAKNELDPVFGRKDEAERVAQILARRTKNNPVLIGEPGVGKTAIAEKLAMMIYKKECSRSLMNKRIISLDLAALVAGTKYRGQFEERVKKLLDELRQNKNIIPFIDEIHLIVGAGNAAGSMDAANMFKPALSRGEMQCIGATTTDEYRESIEMDGALDRRFQKVIVDELSMPDTLNALKVVKSRYEEHHKVSYADESLTEIIRLSDRYLTNRFFPDKAIDVMDEAGARCQIGLVQPPIIVQLEKELVELENKKVQMVSSEDFKEAYEVKEMADKIEKQLHDELIKWEKNIDAEKKIITPDMISKTISIMTKIPVDKLSQSERKLLMNIDQTLKQFVIGQDAAIDSVASSIKRNRLGLAKSTKPIGVFLFIGSTGIGKTYLAKMLAKHIFGSEKNLIRFDMSEYSAEFNISRLIGSAPGYVGYGKGGSLTEQVRNNPYSVVLFDEIEKAHPNVYNVLLQLFDEGRLTDEIGRTTNFKNTIIILTSNVGSQELQANGKGIGFNNKALDNDRVRAIIEKAMKIKFKPEFLNRIDEIVQFNLLDEDTIKQIIQLQLAELIVRAAENHYNLIIAPEVNDLIFKEGYNADYGAREIQRTIQRLIENPISDDLLKQDVIEGITINIKVENDNIVISLKQPYIAN